MWTVQTWRSSESDVFLTPQENGGQPTHEIYLAKDDTLLYSNGDK